MPTGKQDYELYMVDTTTGERIKLQDIKNMTLEELDAEMAEYNFRRVVHGKWVLKDGHLQCSNCNEYSDDNDMYPYCRWCGAKMEE